MGFDWGLNVSVALADRKRFTGGWISDLMDSLFEEAVAAVQQLPKSAGGEGIKLSNADALAFYGEPPPLPRQSPRQMRAQDYTSRQLGASALSRSRGR